MSLHPVTGDREESKDHKADHEDDLNVDVFGKMRQRRVHAFACQRAVAVLELSLHLVRHLDAVVDDRNDEQDVRHPRVG